MPNFINDENMTYNTVTHRYTLTDTCFNNCMKYYHANVCTNKNDFSLLK